MKIDRTNYELFFVDYHDGNLQENQIDALLHFLKNNPDLEQEFYEFENISTHDETLAVFSAKSALLKSVNDIDEINPANFDEFCVAYIENDLSAQNKAKFEHYISENKAYQLELEKYKKTKLSFELQAYPNKSKLIKYTGRVLYLRNAVRYAAAASIIAAGILFFRYNSQEKVMVAETATEVQYVEYDDSPLALVESEEDKTENKTDASKTAENKEEAKKVVDPAKKPASDKIESGSEKAVEQKKTEQLKPVLKKGIFIVRNEWEKPLLPNQPVQAYDAESELESLMAGMPEKYGDELTIDKVRALLSDNNKKLQDLSVWELADMGLRSFGRLTESEYSVKPVISDQGKLESVAFTTEKYTLFAPLRRKK